MNLDTKIDGIPLRYVGLSALAVLAGGVIFLRSRSASNDSTQGINADLGFPEASGGNYHGPSGGGFDLPAVDVQKPEMTPGGGSDVAADSYFAEGAETASIDTADVTALQKAPEFSQPATRKRKLFVPPQNRSAGLSPLTGYEAGPPVIPRVVAMNPDGSQHGGGYAGPLPPIQRHSVETPTAPSAGAHPSWATEAPVSTIVSNPAPYTGPWGGWSTSAPQNIGTTPPPQAPPVAIQAQKSVGVHAA